MKITDAYWTCDANVLEILCHECEFHFIHRADRWFARCPFCGTAEKLGTIRERYVEEHDKP